MSCEWNPEQNRLAYIGEPCHNGVAYIVGARSGNRKSGVSVQVCSECVKLPQFALAKKKAMTPSKGEKE